MIAFVYYRGIEEIPETVVPVAIVAPIAVQNGEPTEEVGEIYVSCYPYQSSESGDLVFDVGEVIRVIKKEGDWWTGVINTNTGIFPANYVQLPNDITSVPQQDNNPIEISNGNGEMIQNEERIESNMAMSAEEERNQADADSEVSQINTQTPTNDTANQDFRSMSSMSSATPVSFLIAFGIDPWNLNVCKLI